MFGIMNAYLGSRMTGVTGRGGHAEPDGQALKSSALAGAAQTVAAPGAGWGEVRLVPAGCLAGCRRLRRGHAWCASSEASQRCRFHRVGHRW